MTQTLSVNDISIYAKNIPIENSGAIQPQQLFIRTTSIFIFVKYLFNGVSPKEFARFEKCKP